jgi:hypothetical protein
MSDEPRDLDKAIASIQQRMEREKLIGLIEILLGNMVALDGIEATKAVLAKFQDQLEHY